jgi:hypothetical protein
MHRRWAQQQLTPLIKALHARVDDLEARLAHALDTGQATV